MSNIKPFTNRFMVTKSQERKFRRYIAKLPSSKFYRKELEPLLGAAVDLCCDEWKIIPSVVDGKECLRLLMLNVKIVKVPKSRGIDVPVVIEHIWTVLDKDWYERNSIQKGYILKLRGFLYLYSHHKMKNIGFQAFSAKPVI